MKNSHKKSTTLLVLGFIHFSAYVLAEECTSSPFLTVITAEDIRSIGATDLDEALAIAPGLHVSKMFTGNPIYTFRGIHTDTNPQARLLINGIDMTNVYQGNRNPTWAGMPVEAIACIEVVRGPNPTFYNTSAFAGIINVVTKSKQDIQQLETGIRRGSFDTTDAWVLGSSSWNGFEMSAVLEYHDTEGHKEIVSADQQSYLDSVFGTKASLAPGPVNLQRENFDLRLEVERGLWRWRTGLQKRGNIGYYAGDQSLDPILRHASDRLSTDLTYHRPQLNDDWEIEVQLSYLESDWTIEPGRGKRVFPPGANLGNGVYPDGLKGNPEIWERHTRLNGSVLYNGFEQHHLRVSSGFNYADLYQVRETKNFGINPTTGEPLPPDSPMVDVTDTPYIFLAEGDRKNFYLILQDEWTISPHWNLVLGGRYDDYSEFGQTSNPHVALRWLIQPQLNAQLSYNRSVRPPSFLETRVANNPATLGNPNLSSETIESVELAFDYQPTKTSRLSLNLFHYQWEDIIQLVPDSGETTLTFQNLGKQTGRGLELTANWQLLSSLKIQSYYAFQRSINDETDTDAGKTPHHQIYLRADWNFAPDWHLNTQTKWIIDRERSIGDHRPKIGDYHTVDLTLRHQQKHWEGALSVRNLLDADALEPSPPGDPVAAFPNDLPLAGRSFFGEIRYRF